MPPNERLRGGGSADDEAPRSDAAAIVPARKPQRWLRWTVAILCIATLVWNVGGRLLKSRRCRIQMEAIHSIQPGMPRSAVLTLLAGQSIESSDRPQRRATYAAIRWPSWDLLTKKVIMIEIVYSEDGIVQQVVEKQSMIGP
jgi:hypothetical protein